VVGATVFVIAVPEFSTRAGLAPRGPALTCNVPATAVALLSYLEALAWYLVG
jgi:hypothetical protein